VGLCAGRGGTALAWTPARKLCRERLAVQPGHARFLDGFLDGSTDGDGCRSKRGNGRTLVSANVPSLAALAELVGARFTPRTNGLASHLVDGYRLHPHPGFLGNGHLARQAW
jgi:hypothetical protein